MLTEFCCTIIIVIIAVKYLVVHIKKVCTWVVWGVLSIHLNTSFKILEDLDWS